MLTFTMGDERRAAQRIRAYRPVQLRKTGTGPLIETLTKDLSIDGLRCISSLLFPVETELTVQLLLSTGEEPVTARGRTVWFRTLPQSEQVELGICFTEIPQPHQRRLSAYLERLSTHADSLLA